MGGERGALSTQFLRPPLSEICGFAPGTASNGLNDPLLEKINWNAAVQHHPTQCPLFQCKKYHKKPSLRSWSV